MPATNDASQRQQAAADRRLRDQIRAVAERANVERDELVDLSSNKLEQELNTLNALLGQIQRPREHAEDAEAFGVIAQRGLESSRLLAAGGKFRTPRALAARLKAAFGIADASAAAGAAGTSSRSQNNTSNRSTIDWDPLARLASSLFRVAPGLSCALGPLNAPRKKAAVRALTRRRTTPPPVSAPTVRGGGENGEGLGVGEGQDDGPAQETDRRMEAMLAELVSAARRAASASASAAAAGDCGRGESSDGSVRAIEAILDHSSFATTVENLFALSFLIRDGHVSLTDSSRGYRVKAVRRSGGAGRGAKGAAAGNPSSPGAAAAAGASSNAENSSQHHQLLQHRQLVLAYSTADFEEWKRAVDPRDCLMPKLQASLAGNAPAPAAPAAAAAAARAPAAVGAARVPPNGNDDGGGSRGRAPPGARPALNPAPPASSSSDGEEEEDAPAKRHRGGGAGLRGGRKGGEGGPMLLPRPARRG